MRVRRAAPAALLAVLLAGSARAQEVPPDEDPARWLKEIDLEAGSAEADLRLRELDLRDGVKVRLPPYHLRAERIHLSLGKWGVRVKGMGLLTFCPCESPPVAVGFSGGWAGPPDELIVENPTLRVFGLPIFWLPYLWLRSPRKIGLTTPDVSFRGPDGLFLGQGVHVPVGSHGLELGAGVYTAGGFAANADLVTDRTSTLIRFDYRRGRDVPIDVPSGVGLNVDARGTLGRAATLTWDVDALRGARGVRTVLDLDPLARPYDHADVVARVGPVASGVTMLDRRFSPIDSATVVRPWVGLAGAIPLGALGGSNGSIAVGPRWVRDRGVETIGDASLAVSLAGPVGISILSSSLRLDGRAARAGGDAPDAYSGGRLGAVVADARVEASLPLARRIDLERARGGPPVLHVIEPLLRASIVAARASGDRRALSGFVAAPAFAEDASRTALLSVVGARTSLGSFNGGIAPGRDPWIGRLGAELTSGVLQLDAQRDVAASSRIDFTARRSDGARTILELAGAATRRIERAGTGWLVAGRTRWESSRDGFGVELRGAARSAISVLAGWALLGAELAPRLTTATGLSSPGTTVGLGAGFPIGFGIRIGGDVDVYGDTARALVRDTRLLDVRGTLRYRHPCGCFRFAVRGGRVVGREGVDVFATFELARTDPNDPRDF